HSSEQEKIEEDRETAPAGGNIRAEAARDPMNTTTPRLHYETALATARSLTTRALRSAQINRVAVERAIAECLTSVNAPQRPVRWFDDVGSARAYLAPETPNKAYWHLRSSAVGSALDAAWSAALPDIPSTPGRLPRRWVDSYFDDWI